MTFALTSARLLADPVESNVFLSAADWVQTVLLGPLATSIAVIAVASIGLLMLSGRVNVRRGATVIIGCFILFGAATIATGLRSLAANAAGDAPPPQTVPIQAGPPIDLRPPPADETLVSEDPYAGASIRR